MSPKEKAEDLFNKYATYVVMWTGGSEVERQNCKQCALIAVDEILDNFGSLVGDKTHYCNYLTTQYYQEVKEEIEKL